MMKKKKIASCRMVVPVLLLPDADSDPDNADPDDDDPDDADPDKDDEKEDWIRQSGCSGAVAALCSNLTEDQFSPAAS